MKICFLLVFFIAIFACKPLSIAEQKAKLDEKIPAAFLLKDLDELYARLQKDHPFLYRYISKEELEFKLDSIKKTIREPLSSKEFYPKVLFWVSQVRQGHLSASLPPLKYSKQEKNIRDKIKFPINQFDYYIENNKLFIKKNASKDSIISLGSEIVSIDNENVESMLTNYKTLFASDGFNTTFKNRLLADRFSGFYNRNHDSKDSLTLELKLKDELKIMKIKKYFITNFKSKQDSLKHIDSINNFKKISKKLKKEILNKLKIQHERKNLYAYNKYENEFARELKFKENATAYLKINSFALPQYKKFYKEVFRKIDSAKTQNLIIDVRKNGGGNPKDIAELCSYLIDKPFYLVENAKLTSKFALLKPAYGNQNFLSKLFNFSYGFYAVLFKTKKVNNEFEYVMERKENQPKTNNFKGKIYIITSGMSFSATSIFASFMDGEKRATFVGEESGGDYNGTVAGRYYYYTLPNSKIKVNIGLMEVKTQYNQDIIGRGKLPDIELQSTLEEILTKKDREVEWIMNEILTKKNN